MDKFSKVQTVQTADPKKDDNLVFQGEYLKIFNDNGWEFVDEKDLIVILPYFKDEGYILLRSEPVPPYQYKYRNTTNYANKSHFITAISGGIEKDKGESVVAALRRELHEEAGLIISQFYEFHINGPFFFSKGNTGQYFTCLMELNYNDYRQVMATTDGTPEEANSKTLKVSLGDIDSLWISDMVTQYLITQLKYEYKI